MNSDISLLRNVLNITFETNLLYFKEKFPHFYEKFKEYERKEYGLELDKNGCLNIACNGHFIYDDDPRKIAKIQAEEFVKKPTRNIYRMNPMTDEELISENPLKFRHLDYVVNIARLGQEYEFKAIRDDANLIPIGRNPFLSVIGVGLGYHLEELPLESVEHLYIYEPKDDLFYASMFTINWRYLVEKFEQDNKSITILVGNTKEQFFEGLQTLFHKFGMFKSAVLPYFNHYESITASEIIEYVNINGRVLYSGFGFMEDEIMSLVHTYKNLYKEPSILGPVANLKEDGFDYPLFICGSGPSMDESYDYIKANRDKAIVVSCGSGVVALFKYGIKPDIHVDVERTKPVYDWLKTIQDEDSTFLEGVTFIGMNNVYPDVQNLFDRKMLFLKPNDAGTDMIRVTYNSELPLIYGSNPTCVNGAVGFFNNIGSGDIYLFGCDFGYKDETKHHSKNSGYFDTFKEYNKDAYAKLATREGNFGGKVFTDQTYDSCRHSVEYSIRHHVKDENKTVFNCSDGAKVVGTQPLHLEDIELEQVLDKKAFSDCVLSYGKDNVLSPKTWEREINDRINKTIDVIDNVLINEELLEVNIEPEQVIDIFTTMHNKIMELDGSKDIVGIRTLKGSIVYVQCSITGYIYLIGNNEHCKTFIKESFKVMFAYYKELRQILLDAADEMGANRYEGKTLVLGGIQES